ncbi:hypothetical protein DVH24_010873 [Malus domestica]|uniref:Uncharacterized protein n=1 Tax=Malus domestica TaxID=3750 RepID=A0A498JS03_MALDO|nr:hypothetical protein DVH24_010873 [Malus domestica]
MLTVDLSQCCKCKDTLKPAGDTLNSSSSLVSASEKFSFSSCVHDDSSKSTSYVSIQSNKADGNIAWICNPPQTTRSTNISNSIATVVAILLDSGNFVQEEVNVKL